METESQDDYIAEIEFLEGLIDSDTIDGVI